MLRDALRETYPYFLGGVAEQPNADLVVVDKYSGAPATRVALADARALDRAIELAAAASGASCAR